MAEFAKKVVLVTGAGRGIGRAIALAFASQGAILALNDLTPVNLDVTLERIQAMGAKACDYVFDIAKKMPAQEMVEQVLRDWGRIDYLVNNAGVHPVVPLLEMDEWDLRRTLDVNLVGPFFTIQGVGRIMRQQGGGVIVNLAAALDDSRMWQNSAAFLASKAGLINLTQQAARELSVYGIRVNAVCPGATDTEGYRVWSQLRLPEMPFVDQFGGQEPGLPELVAEKVLFLCSTAARELNGQVLDVWAGPHTPD